MANYDLIIVGGGLAGLALLDKLDKTALKILLVDDKQRQQQPAARPLVLNKKNAESLNCPLGYRLEAIKASIFDKPGILNLKAAKHGLDYFALVVNAVELYQQLLQRNINFIQHNTEVLSVKSNAAGAQVTLASGDILAAKLVVVADGSNSAISEKLKLNKISASTMDIAIKPEIQLLYDVPAQLRFVPGGTLAYLPVAAKQGTIVATGAATQCDMRKYWRQHLPIVQVPELNISYTHNCFYLESLCKDNVVFLGNAAHSLAPVGAQGFNLACSAALKLAALINNSDLSQVPALYQAELYDKMAKVFHACDFLAHQSLTGKYSFSSLGLLLMNTLNPLQAEVVNFGMGSN